MADASAPTITLHSISRDFDADERRRQIRVELDIRDDSEPPARIALWFPEASVGFAEAE